jgi:hypothetical protein
VQLGLWMHRESSSCKKKRPANFPCIELVAYPELRKCIAWAAYNGIKEALHRETVKIAETLAKSSGSATDHEG